MNLTKNLQTYIEEAISMFENKDQHETLFREVLTSEGPYFTGEEIILFFNLIENLNDPDLNKSVKEYVLDIVVEVFNEFYTGKVTEEEVRSDYVMYLHTPKLTKNILVKHLAVCGVKSVKEFLSYLEDAMPQVQLMLINDQDEDTDETWSVIPEIYIHSDLDPISSEEYIETDMTEVEARDLILLYSSNLQQLFENIVEEQYKLKGIDLIDLSRFV